MRSNTYIIDIDGTVFFKGESTNEWFAQRALCPGVLEFFQKIEKQSACIVLMTAEKESMRPHLESELRRHKLFWDHLVMGVSNGCRVLVNDGPTVTHHVQVNEGLLCLV